MQKTGKACSSLGLPEKGWCLSKRVLGQTLCFLWVAATRLRATHCVEFLLAEFTVACRVYRQQATLRLSG
ncbi:hypothetical protein APA22_02990 [Acetobacter pasteurianus IFO 3283-22]|uniref:Uncharacterized protein n=1 Tax=Acetobacter pasteurianus (strain NBRC 105184 / IFO 3283-01) TaxID=634452 RepID=C7JC34_ACEP3|nr:hypothetical protein APA01_02990 [Acetobacter pasteurianus IFO 3283-01]BAI01502.1 hypothetical protein APA03_02990 [Acetobacter pasteurianus IFO 3283-03]BAI04550.1 hypothetical protein APA07_02990 [Acetobacter pasteurianus IFO 3283-07]BAI07597.1 hypothetical protein APA22_02990 [Acetobacter pasteurianus IFO 3283-22]BAI10645.1 hypothetical protein APA26_02990 [Acetobacter pasteurianus IFO 3283-26]BAI13693.1 hypothetical protein APA32_02990 [Acetobacter pasteurianus IFO 3283-32]BAI16739.1 hy